MPEPYQPVDHLVVSRLVPLNSSSNLSVQSPGSRSASAYTAGRASGRRRRRRMAGRAGGRFLMYPRDSYYDDDQNGADEQP